MGAQASTFMKSEHLWFPPDMVVIRAQGHIFRVFAAILKEKSFVFEEMLDPDRSRLGQPQAKLEYIEGYPVLDLPHDAGEVDVFLRTLFDTEFTFPSFDTRDVAAVLRLSDKYQIPFLRRRALSQLELVYNTCVVQQETASRLGITGFDGRFRRRENLKSTFSVQAHLVAIKVFSEVGATWMLPAAFYELCAFDIRTIKSAGSAWDELDEKQKMACIAGHSALGEHYPKFVAFHLMASSKADCRSMAQCDRNRLLHASECLHYGQPRRPLHVFDDGYWTKMGQVMCASCLHTMKTNRRVAQETLWNLLPEMFDLPSWGISMQMRREQLLM